MTSEGINVGTGTRRVGYAHRWAKFALRVSPLLFCMVGFACDQIPQPVALRMPNEQFVTEIGRSSNGLPLTASVPVAIHQGDPVILKLKITNVLDHPYSDSFDVSSHTADRFIVWLLCDGKEIPLTKYGEGVQPRRTAVVDVIVSALPARKLAPGESHTQQISLQELFQIDRPGNYTVIAERRPVFSNDDPCREQNAVKSSFTLLPQQLTTDH